MPYQFWRLVDTLTRQAGQLDRNQWVILSLLVVTIGLVCMRGFGSRNSY